MSKDGYVQCKVQLHAVKGMLFYKKDEAIHTPIATAVAVKKYLRNLRERNLILAG